MKMPNFRSQFPFYVIRYTLTIAFGADNQIFARQTRDQLIELLKKGSFCLRKWASNATALPGKYETGIYQ